METFAEVHIQILSAKNDGNLESDKDVFLPHETREPVVSTQANSTLHYSSMQMQLLKLL